MDSSAVSLYFHEHYDKHSGSAAFIVVLRVLAERIVIHVWVDKYDVFYALFIFIREIVQNHATELHRQLLV
jgi:hypothetical protein